MPVPQNAKAIYGFLTAAGLSANAAAGILGNMAQESGGNPESVGTGGGGLIGWTPLPGGFVTGNSSADLAKQLPQVLAYIKANGSISDINAHASSPTAAALWFMNQYERPKAGPSANVGNRTQSANDVAAAAKSGNWPKASTITTSGTTQATTTASVSGGVSIPGLSSITPFFSDAAGFVNKLLWLTHPANWIRIVAFLAGVALLLFALHAFIAVGNNEPIIQAPNVIPVPV